MLENSTKMKNNATSFMIILKTSTKSFKEGIKQEYIHENMKITQQLTLKFYKAHIRFMKIKS